MSLSIVAGYLAGLMYAIAAIWYVIDIAKQRVNVSIASNVIFTIINTSQLLALIEAKVWGVVPFTVVGLSVSLSICLISIKNKKIYFELMDKVGFIGALVGIVVWWLTNDPALNIYVLSIVNIFAFSPIIIKTFKHPNYETVKPWRVNLLASIFLLFSISTLSLVEIIVPVREFVSSSFMNIALSKKYKSMKGAGK